MITSSNRVYRLDGYCRHLEDRWPPMLTRTIPTTPNHSDRRATSRVQPPGHTLTLIMPHLKTRLHHLPCNNWNVSSVLGARDAGFRTLPTSDLPFFSEERTRGSLGSRHCWSAVDHMPPLASVERAHSSGQLAPTQNSCASLSVQEHHRYQREHFPRPSLPDLVTTLLRLQPLLECTCVTFSQASPEKRGQLRNMEIYLGKSSASTHPTGPTHLEEILPPGSVPLGCRPRDLAALEHQWVSFHGPRKRPL